MPQKVVADTNGLLMPFESGIRLDAELGRLLGTYEVIVPEAVFVELAEIASQAKGRRRDNARMALTLAARFTYGGGKGKGDAAVLEAARANAALVLTNDRDLIGRALTRGLGVVRLKGKSHLVLQTSQGEAR